MSELSEKLTQWGVQLKLPWRNEDIYVFDRTGIVVATAQNNFQAEAIVEVMNWVTSMGHQLEEMGKGDKS